METISVERPAEWDSCEVMCFADVHLGDLSTDGNLLLERIRHCEETEKCVVILNGDLCNNAVLGGKSDVFAETATPMEELKQVVKLFGTLAEQGKIIAMTDGNHERRTYRTNGLDMSAVIASQLGVPYSPGAMLIFLRFGKMIGNHSHGRKQLYTIFCNHGSGSGSKIGGKANRLVSMSEIIDADIFLHSHVHEPLIVKRGFYRTSAANNSVSFVERLYVNTAAYLDYGGYGEIAEYTPNAKSTPVILLDGHKRKMIARM